MFLSLPEKDVSNMYTEKLIKRLLSGYFTTIIFNKILDMHNANLVVDQGF